jgi:hypothetical protein
MFDRFREQQIVFGGKVTAADKRSLKNKLNKLSNEMDKYLAADSYKIDLEDENAFASWRASHQPFHWFAEFYGVINEGGFDVVIGNPPWKEYSSVKKFYTVKSYATEHCGNLYGICSERVLDLCQKNAYFSFIVQMPFVCSSRMDTMRKILRNAGEMLWTATFDDRPSKLFEGLQHCRSGIFILKKSLKRSQKAFTTRYHRWHGVSRSNLFLVIRFVAESGNGFPARIAAKHADWNSVSIFSKFAQVAAEKTGKYFIDWETANFIFYQEATQYWVKATTIFPFYAKNGVESAPSHGRTLYFTSVQQAKTISAVLNSNLFYVYFIAYGDCFHLSQQLVENFPINKEIIDDAKLEKLNDSLIKELMTHAERKKISSRNGDVVDIIEYDEFFASRCKNIIDEIDTRLGKFYSFTDEELDFIINYDIKYRMGGADDGE